MSYANSSSYLTSRNPGRSSLGIAFVVSLHIAAIVAIGNGLKIYDAAPKE